jgi:transcription elongation factor Elf1
MANEDVAEAEYFNVMVKILKRHFETIGTEKLNDAIAKGLELFLHSKEDESKEVDVMATIDSMMGLSKISRVGNHACGRCGQMLSFTANRTQLQLESPDRKAKKSKSHAYTVALIFTCSHCGHAEQSVADSTIYVPQTL